MRLVVLDTNVIVSAGIKPSGAPAKIVMDWVLEGQVQIVTCPLIADEYRRVIGRPKFRRFGFPPLWLEFLIEESLQLSDTALTWARQLPDENDLPFLALAHQAGAWLVTGNLKHFPTAIRNRVKVVSPADYLAQLEK
jgi:putative PIN family toxin of toxin-antitoxin system